jgi:hypothetical protein
MTRKVLEKLNLIYNHECRTPETDTNSLVHVRGGGHEEEHFESS